MGRVGRQYGVWIERGALAGAVLSSVVLILAARSSPADPKRAEDAALQEIATRLSRGVRSAWERALTGTGPAEPASVRFHWTEAPAPPPEPIRAGPGTTNSLAFDMDLLSATQAELGSSSASREPDLEGARAWVSTALSRPDIDAARRGRGWLRGIQLAVISNDADFVHAQLAEAGKSLSGLEVTGDTSLLLLCALAASPQLNEEQRVDWSTRLLSMWERDELALPQGLPTLERDGARVTALEDPDVLVLLEALVEMGGTPSSTMANRRAVRALERVMGSLPAPPQVNRWSLEATSLGLLCSRRQAEGSEAFFVDPNECVASLTERARREGLLTGDLRIEVSGTSEGQVVVERLGLVGSDLVVDVTHPNPGELVMTERRTAERLRFALFGSAFVLTLAGLMTFRALRRERLLQALRVSFIANVSHELRTPLASILLMAENLEEGRVAAERTDRYHRGIRSEALRLRRLVEDVLDFSRLERGQRPELRREDVRLDEWLTAMERAWALAAERTGSVVHLERGAFPEAFSMDGEAVRRVLDNLVDNAFKYGGGEVTVSVGAIDQELEFTVRDRGDGIAPGSAERVFEPFVRLDKTLDTPSAGAGLGLAIARETIEAHGGRLEVVQPAAGPGVILRVRLPLEEDLG